jgi:hypothetical protein
MTDGENTPATVNAPPKIAPDAIDFRVAEDISGRDARLQYRVQGQMMLARYLSARRERKGASLYRMEDGCS